MSMPALTLEWTPDKSKKVVTNNPEAIRVLMQKTIDQLCENASDIYKLWLDERSQNEKLKSQVHKLTKSDHSMTEISKDLVKSIKQYQREIDDLKELLIQKEVENDILRKELSKYETESDKEDE